MIRESNNVKQIDQRLRKLPDFFDNIMYSLRKGDAVKFIDSYQKNIRYNRLNLEPLKPSTVKGKERKGYSKPSTPLYGLGDRDDKSYINMFLLRKIKRGWKAYPRWAKHHDADLQLRQLLEIHESGRTIKRGNVLIRIEPRPVAWLTYRKILKEMKSKASSREVKKAITQYINKGNQKLINEIIKHGDSIGTEHERE